MNIEIANRLFELRKKKNLSQEELADKIGVSRQAVSKWERAESSPDTDNLIELARLYEISLDELLFTSEPVSKEKEKSEESPVSLVIENENAPPQYRRRNILYALPISGFICIAYVIIGIIFDIWHPTWLMFLGIPIYYCFVSMFTSKGLKAKFKNFPIPLLCAAAFLILGFCFGLWHPGWAVFLIIPVYYTLANIFRQN
jgi:transcriptional regulator with XRE-family HTH domain